MEGSRSACSASHSACEANFERRKRGQKDEVRGKGTEGKETRKVRQHLLMTSA